MVIGYDLFVGPDGHYVALVGAKWETNWILAIPWADVWILKWENSRNMYHSTYNTANHLAYFVWSDSTIGGIAAYNGEGTIMPEHVIFPPKQVKWVILSLNQYIQVIIDG